MVFQQLIHDPFFLNGLVLLASLFILYKSAELIILSISNYAHKFGLSDALIGLVVVAMAASSPEIISSLMGFLAGEENVGFGTILGSNMVHASLALGLLALFGRKVTLEENIFTKQKLFMWSILMLPFLLALDGTLSRVDGILLLLAFATYIGRLWHLEGTLGKLKKDVAVKHLWKDVFVFLGSFIALLLAGQWLVFSSINIAAHAGIPSYFIALTIIGIGTTIPDLVVEIGSLFQKHAAIGLGDLLGSLIIELVLFFGIVALINPIEVTITTVLNALLFLAGTITLILFFIQKKELNWKHGIVLLCIYFVFLAIEIVKM